MRLADELSYSVAHRSRNHGAVLRLSCGRRLVLPPTVESPYGDDILGAVAGRKSCRFRDVRLVDFLLSFFRRFPVRCS
jgi:hypothetical protein